MKLNGKKNRCLLLGGSGINDDVKLNVICQCLKG